MKSLTVLLWGNLFVSLLSILLLGEELIGNETASRLNRSKCLVEGCYTLLCNEESSIDAKGDS